MGADARKKFRRGHRYSHLGADAQPDTGGLAALAGGLVLRVAWILVTADEPAAVADPDIYLYMADRAVDGHWLTSPLWPFGTGSPTSFLSVAYPSLLAIITLISFGALEPYVAALVINVLASATLILGAAAVARRLASIMLGSPAPLAATAAAWLLALHP